MRRNLLETFAKPKSKAALLRFARDHTLAEAKAQLRALRDGKAMSEEHTARVLRLDAALKEKLGGKRVFIM